MRLHYGRSRGCQISRLRSHRQSKRIASGKDPRELSRRNLPCFPSLFPLSFTAVAQRDPIYSRLLRFTRTARDADLKIGYRDEHLCIQYTYRCMYVCTWYTRQNGGIDRDWKTEKQPRISDLYCTHSRHYCYRRTHVFVTEMLY